MRFYISFILTIFLYTNVTGQNLSELKTYLDSNSTPINLNQSNKIFKSVMKNKVLFVLGEGGSHDLELYYSLRPYLLSEFSKLNLKYFFIEGSRSRAFTNNEYLQNPADYSDSIFQNEPSYKIEMKKIRQFYNSGTQFEYKGIDMEWSKRLYNATKSITVSLTQTTIKSIPLLYSILIDTAYLHYDDKNTFNNQKHFLKYYKNLQNIFVKDSTSLKNNLKPIQYQQLNYLLSNPQTSPPNGDRNSGMAKNLIAEISPIDTNATYLLDIGIAHSLLNRKSAVIGILNETTILANKIVIMNVFCDECSINGKKLNDNPIEFMKGELLDIFRASAKNDLTIFDLSKVPAKFDYLKKYGDLILFAKKQK
jgi:hypothetical protein